MQLSNAVLLSLVSAAMASPLPQDSGLAAGLASLVSAAIDAPSTTSSTPTSGTASATSSSPFDGISIAPTPSVAPVGTNSTSVAPAQSEDKSLADNAAFIASLITAGTAVERHNILNQDSDWVFDYGNPVGGNTTGAGAAGRTVRSQRSAWPALIGNGLSMTLGFIGPCGLNTPHVHPRSTELLVVPSGSLVVEFFAENDVKVIKNRIDQYQSTVIPQGAIHTEFNPTCGDSLFVSAFASEDPGTLQVAQGLFSLDDDLLSTMLQNGGTFPGDMIDSIRAAIPPSVALGVESCLSACGIAKRK